MDDEKGAGARRKCVCPKCFEIDLPAVIVDQRIGHQANVGEVGKEFEQRIAGRRYQDFVTGLAEQAEYVGVGFAGAGGEENALWIEAL